MTLLAALNVVFSSIPGTLAPQRFRWRSDKISLSVSRSLVTPNSNITSGSDVVGSIRRSVVAWNAVGNVDIVAVESDAASASPAGPEGDGVSVITIAATPENILMFERTDEAVAAKTRVFYNRRGFITEADIVLNPFQQFSTDGSYGTFDLETVIKHELGHLLGLGHSNVAGSLMYDSTAKNGVFGGPETIARDISTDDIASIRDLYPEPNDESCCGVISGRLTGLGRQARSSELWAEDADSGDVAAHSVTSRDGNFRFGGISAGTYRIFVRPVSKLRDFSVVDLGEITVEAFMLHDRKKNQR